MRLGLFLVALASVAPAASCDRPAKSLRPPNVVLIVVDSLRYDHTTVEDGRANTPTIRALARDGVSFPNAFTHSPITLPAHTALFSSRLPAEAGVRNNAQSVPKDVPLFASWLSQHGYATQAAVSLASLWPTAGGRGLDRGFDRYDKGEWSSTRAEDLDHALETTLDEVVERQPFFVFAHYSDPHEPYDAHGTVERYAHLTFDGREYGTVCTSETTLTRREVVLAPGDHELDVNAQDGFKLRSFEIESRAVELGWELVDSAFNRRSATARVRIVNPSQSNVSATMSLWLTDAPADSELAPRYRAEVEYTDASLASLIAGLKRRGLYDTSVIVLTSDHGEALGEHSTWGHTADLYDELLHVPLIVKLPSSHSAHAELRKAQNELVRQIDVVPTLLDLVGLPPLPGQKGQTLLSPSKLERIVIAHAQRADGSQEAFCARDKRYKLIYTPSESRFEMYDLEKDPGELGDVFAARSGERAQWLDTLKALAARTRREGDRQIDPEVKRRLEQLGY